MGGIREAHSSAWPASWLDNVDRRGLNRLGQAPRGNLGDFSPWRPIGFGHQPLGEQLGDPQCRLVADHWVPVAYLPDFLRVEANQVRVLGGRPNRQSPCIKFRSKPTSRAKFTTYQRVDGSLLAIAEEVADFHFTLGNHVERRADRPRETSSVPAGTIPSPPRSSPDSSGVFLR